MRIFPLLILLLAFTASAQQPDRWRGLVIDETTADEALKVLGKPKSDKKSVPGGTLVVKWEKKKRPADGRVLHYEKLEGFGDVKLFFDKDNKLVTIMLEPDKLSPQELIASYSSIDFRAANEVLSPSDLDRPRNNLEIPSQFAVVYVLVGANEKVVVSAGIGNATGNVMSTLFRDMPSRQTGRTYPGKVQIIALSSRRLLDGGGSDLLK